MTEEWNGHTEIMFLLGCVYMYSFLASVSHADVECSLDTGVHSYRLWCYRERVRNYLHAALSGSRPIPHGRYMPRFRFELIMHLRDLQLGAALSRLQVGLASLPRRGAPETETLRVRTSHLQLRLSFDTLLEVYQRNRLRHRKVSCYAEGTPLLTPGVRVISLLWCVVVWS